MLIQNLSYYAKHLRSLVAYTIMPNHVNMLVEVNTTLRDFKKRTSKEIKRMLRLDNPHIWQRGTMDHYIRVSWENTDFRRHLEYLYYNSWKHLGIRPKDFQFHNFVAAVQEELIEMDFCTFDEENFPESKLYE